MTTRVANNAFGTLAANITDTDPTITLSTGQGARFPSLGPNDNFWVTLVDSSNNLEIVNVTARTDDVLTVLRGQDGTLARAYSLGNRVELRPVAALLNAKMDSADANISFLPITGTAVNATRAGDINPSEFLRRDTAGRWTLASNIASTDFSEAIQLREVNYSGANNQNLSFAPRLAMHWSGVVAVQLSITPDGRFAMLNSAGTANASLNVGNVFATGTVNADAGTSIGGNHLKITLRDNATVRGYLGADTTNPIVVRAPNQNIVFRVDTAGNGTFTANMTAFSDDRIKTNWRSLKKDFVREFAGTTYGVYDRTDIKMSQVGVSAQSLQRTMPEAVLRDADSGLLKVSYGQAALAAAVELANYCIELQRQIEVLKRRVDDMGVK